MLAEPKRGGQISILPTNSAYGAYSLSNGLLTTVGLNAEQVGAAGTGIFTQTGGANITYALALAGNATLYGGTNLATSGTYNLNGGLLQTGSISYGNAATSPIGFFNFNAGTLQAAAGGLNNYIPITVGTATSNVATIDAAGQTVSLNSPALLTRLFLPAWVN